MFDIEIVIVGLGLMGGSYGLALKEQGFKNVCGVDKDREIIDRAIVLKAIDRGTTDIERAIKTADIVIIAVYPKLTKKLIIDNMGSFKSGAIVTDIAGIKEDLVSSIVSHAREDIDFIGGHPMAGKESMGIENATSDIFKGANYILTPTEKNSRTNIETLKKIIYKIGFKNVFETDPTTHDENIAYVSQLPHIVAVGMINCKSIDNIDMFAGGSYRDTTRIAKINGELWSEIFIENKKHLVNQLDLFINYIEKIKTSIEDEDKEELKEILNESFYKKGGNDIENS